MRRILIALFLLLPVLAAADAKIPTEDAKGARDLPFLKRYEGSYIVDYEQRAFDQFRLPLSALEEVPKKDGAKSRSEFAAGKGLVLEGRYTRILYLSPAGRSPLEVVRNYVDEIRAGGGTALYSCKNEGCGGRLTGNYSGAAGRSLLATLYPPERISAPFGSSGHCASHARINEQRYVAFKQPTPDGDAHLALLVYGFGKTSSACKAFTDRTVAMVIAIEPKAREQKMVTVSAAEMAQSLASTGRIALYGIYFDTNKAEIKPESTPALEQIAALLKADPALKIMVVGHTDNVGTSAANMDLSKRRANAVVATLTGQYGAKAAQMEAAGMGMLAPVASNDLEEGRAKNRRVELVKK